MINLIWSVHFEHDIKKYIHKNEKQKQELLLIWFTYSKSSGKNYNLFNPTPPP